MRLLLAFDKFKDSLTAEAACRAAAAPLRAAHPEWEIDWCPLADGGEGFAEILTRAAGGEMKSLPVTGPRGVRVDAAFGLVACEKIPAPARRLLDLPSGARRVAVVEMAAASGLALLAQPDRDPWQATSLGTGELIAAAIEAGADAILLGVGGSATSDLGLGALQALGLRFFGSHDAVVTTPIPAHWGSIERLGGKLRANLPPIRIACDVSNPLLGPQGAAAIYGPQKGLAPSHVGKLDHAAARLALLLCAFSGRSDTLMDQAGAGAAGGIAFGLMAGAGATLLPGFDLVTSWLDLEPRLAAADVIVTGEGRFDASSLSGKGPGAVAARGLALGKRVHVFAGQVTATETPDGLRLHAITPAGQPLQEALKLAAQNLSTAVGKTAF